MTKLIERILFCDDRKLLALIFLLYIAACSIDQL